MTTETIRPSADQHTRAVWRCMHCKRTLDASEYQARHASGWRIWHGTSQTGQPLVAVYCHLCFNGSPSAPTEPLTGYDAECDTYHARLSDEEAGPIDRETAEDWGDEHQCDPYTRIIQPQGI